VVVGIKVAAQKSLSVLPRDDLVFLASRRNVSGHEVEAELEKVSDVVLVCQAYQRNHRRVVELERRGLGDFRRRQI
jgi:hypothetical protein